MAVLLARHPDLCTAVLFLLTGVGVALFCNLLLQETDQ